MSESPEILVLIGPPGPRELRAKMARLAASKGVDVGEVEIAWLSNTLESLGGEQGGGENFVDGLLSRLLDEDVRVAPVTITYHRDGEGRHPVIRFPRGAFRKADGAAVDAATFDAALRHRLASALAYVLKVAWVRIMVLPEGL